MNATKDNLKTGEQIFEMLASAKSEMARTLLGHAIGATREYENVRSALSDSMSYCQQQLERAYRELNQEGRVPNSLGVLQANGVEVDRLCGELARTRKAAEAAQELLETLGIH